MDTTTSENKTQSKQSTINDEYCEHFLNRLNEEIKKTTFDEKSYFTMHEHIRQSF